ncbi:pentapeptide repeat-containing protein [Spiroplasma sp. ChiS]|uniref:pentapeptide repeat-containing protein n=1 Tax=Spiroplasma sp. ChiS TaxID=2099885 RepID=UPI0018F5F618|nr:pentapeptide repeat-containing protein [Spiroplasma sp. ChiS]
MKTLQDLIKDLTGINVEEQKINDYLEYEALDLKDANLQGADLCYAKLQDADLRDADLKDIKITKEQLDQLTVIEED